MLKLHTNMVKYNWGTKHWRYYDICDNKYESRLTKYIDQGNYSRGCVDKRGVMSLISNEEDNESLSSAMVLYCIICKDADVSVISLFLEKIKNTVKYKETLHLSLSLYLSTMWFQPHIVEKFMEHEINVNFTDGKGRTMLMSCFDTLLLVDNSNLIRKEEVKKVIYMFLERRADVNVSSCVSGMVPLTIACLQQHDDHMVMRLLGLGASVNDVDLHGRTPLGIICTRRGRDNSLEIVNALFENGSDSNLKTKKGSSMFMLFLKKYSKTNKVHQKILQLFIMYGADWYSTNKNGVTCHKMLQLRSDRKGIEILMKFRSLGILIGFYKIIKSKNIANALRSEPNNLVHKEKDTTRD